MHLISLIEENNNATVFINGGMIGFSLSIFDFEEEEDKLIVYGVNNEKMIIYLDGKLTDNMYSYVVDGTEVCIEFY